MAHDYMMRFGICNKREQISFDYFVSMGEQLQRGLETARPNITNTVLLTTDSLDYIGHGSLSVDTPETVAAQKRREAYFLETLTQENWNRAFETDLFLKDPRSDDPYMVCMSVQRRDPKRLLFYAQCLDEDSQAIFESYAQAERGQMVDSGFPKRSAFSLGRALRHSPPDELF